MKCIPLRPLAAIFLALAVAGCNEDIEVKRLTIGGTVTGLAQGNSIQLGMEGSTVTINGNGAYTFPAALHEGDYYNVRIGNQPPGQRCVVDNFAGRVERNVDDVNVRCVDTDTGTVTLGGTVGGLAAGQSVVLRNNGATDLSVAANGSFTFPTPVATGSNYAITVATQPAGQACSVAGGSGVASANVTSIVVTCVDVAPVTYTVGGSVSGLAPGQSVVLQNNGASDLAVSANGAFTFGTPLAGGATYAVTVLTQPTGQTCAVAGGAGTISANVTTVAVTCVNADTAGPQVIDRTPLPLAVGAKVQGEVVTATFDEPVDPATVTVASFTLLGPAGPVAGNVTLSPDNTQVIFTPTTRLAYDADYEATLSTAIEDAAGNALAAPVRWSFNTGKRVSIGFRHMCARTDDGRVKCWGRNTEGQLGYGDTTNRGDGLGANVADLPAVNVGAGRTAVAVMAADYHTCAVLDTFELKCWGEGGNGELGQGNTADVGKTAGSMAALQPVDLGGRKVLEVAGGARYTCARLDDSTVKCWGLNDDGQLGQGNATPLGVTPGDIAAANPVDLGPDVRPLSISMGHAHACVLLLDASSTRQVKCWGGNGWGQLGLGDVATRGDGPDEMGANLPAVDVGGTPFKVIASAGHNCVLLTDRSLRCWGLNTWGQVGSDAGANTPGVASCSGPFDCIGDEPGEMGLVLPAPLGPATVARLAVAYRHTCALTTVDLVKCWGTNEQGQIGIEDNAADNLYIGDQPGEMATLRLIQAIPLKPGKTLEEFTAGGFHTCAVNTDGSMNCWGWNADGQLGHGTTTNWGDTPGEMGPGLPDTVLDP